MSASPDPDKAFFGHPAGLKTLFFTEMWERLSYYGARAFLAVYMTTSIAKGGLGMSREAMGLVMALYMSSVYLLSLPGGWIADRFIGQRRAVMIGGIGIMIGSTLLALPIDAAFYPGLAINALGTGLLKPNVSTLVGQLYKQGDIRRDAGFTIYYMGINIGAGLAPLIGMFVAQNDNFRDMIQGWGMDPNLCWKFAFAMPAVGMAAGLIQYKLGWSALGEAGLKPTIPTDPKRAARDRTVLVALVGGLVGIIGIGVLVDTFVVELSGPLIGNIFGVGLAIAAIGLFVGYYVMVQPDERKRITAMLPLFLGSIGFFGVFEQASTTLSIYAEQMVHREFLGINLESSFYQFPNAIFIVLLASPFAWMWLRLAKAGKEPSSVTKFGIGMVFTGLSFVVLLPTVGAITERSEAIAKLGEAALESDVGRVSPMYLIVLYLVATIAELFISPVGLSSMSKLAPARLAGMVMGTWFLATAIGNYIAGRAAGFSEQRGYSFLFTVLIVSSFVIAGALFVVAPMIRRMMENSTKLPKATALERDKADKADKADSDKEAS